MYGLIRTYFFHRKYQVTSIDALKNIKFYLFKKIKLIFM